MNKSKKLIYSKIAFIAILIAISCIFAFVPNVGRAVDMSLGGFGNLPIGKVTTAPSKKVYLGGSAIGIDMRVGGLIVEGISPVVTKNGVVTPMQEANIKKGDIIKCINGKRVTNMLEVTGLMNELDSGSVEISLEREGIDMNISAMAVMDSVSRQYRLGLSLSEGVEGIGTLTFVDPEDGRFGSLGHIIADSGSGISYRDVDGKIHSATIYGVEKGKKGRAGQLIGSFDKGRIYGSLDKNDDHGVFGEYLGDTSAMQSVEIAGRGEVKPGRAEIVTSVFTGEPTHYSIEVVRAYRQEREKVKGMMIRVTDDRLIDVSGGIVQGMSGSPILQNGKLIGAVTHVFVQDATKGYATYLDWMIDK